jgi:HPt (histidine-containing phosphotransfer) domain-containing protein
LLVPLQKEAAQRAAHAVKGAARNFGAVHMANLAEEIERTLAASGQDAAVVSCEALHREFEIVRGLLDPVLVRSQIPAAELSGSRPTTGAPESDAEKHAPQD